MQGDLSARAEQDWSGARRQLLVDRVTCFFKGCSVGMLSFDDARRDGGLDVQIERGRQEIPLEKIVGSVGRFNDFSNAFLPVNPQLKARWQKVDMLMREGKTPPIDVYQVGDGYYVVDGNHRVSVARQRGWETIWANVTELAAAAEPVGEENVEDALLRAERAAFLARVGPENEAAAEAMRFTCAGCYNDLAEQIEQFRQKYEATWPFDMNYEEAFRAWKKEVYDPAVAAIGENDMLAQFPNRTPADLFMWSWRNEAGLEVASGK